MGRCRPTARGGTACVRCFDMNPAELTGQARTHIVELTALSCAVHYEVAASFLSLCDAAQDHGIAVQARSSFRDHATQLGIWNRKWRGERPLYSRSGELLKRAQLADADMVDVILAWSALPGASRHHWGTDIDVVDANAVPPGYQVKLTPEEYAPAGVFGRFDAWLADNLPRFGFFRPYRTDRGGVCPEPWHISYAPVAQPALEALSLAALRRTLADSPLEGQALVLDRLPEIYTRYVLNVDGPGERAAGERAIGESVRANAESA
jgi:LAS superfamily LD-carboxypeptidase LdcB